MSSDFSVVAIVAAYNEADVIEQVVADLIAQGIHVYFLDDGSTDGTVAAVEPFVGRGVLAIERRAETVGNPAPASFEWERILLRKTELARTLDADWFIHHDADEFRESPWSPLTLKDAIRRVDALGFNAIDFASLDFWPTHDNYRAGDDIRAAFPFYSERAPHDRVQIRCWKKTDNLDLASTGGHEARFPDRRVFPVRFILRHYPIRGQGHGERKVFHERQNRFLDRERARGWHVQYAATREGASFLRDPSTLTRYDPESVRLSLMLRHRDVEALEAIAETLAADVARCREEIDARSAEAVELRDQLTARTTDLAARNADVHAQRAEIADLRREIDSCRTRLDALHQSLSWRWTSPARLAYRMIRGR